MAVRVPHGWVDLELVFVDRDPAAITLDCVVAGVRSQRPTDPRAGIEGWPVAVRVASPTGSPERSRLEMWMASNPGVMVLTDDDGSVLVLSLEEETMALELKPR